MYDEENNEIIPTEQVSEDTTEETAEQTQEQPFEETPAEDAATAANPYKQMSEQDYKDSIKQMKLEYKQFQKDKKQAEKQERAAVQETYVDNVCRTGVGTFTSILISAISSVVVFSIIFALLAFFPSKDKSFLASFYKEEKTLNTNSTSNPDGNNIPLGDSSVSKGDNVTINVTGQSGISQAVYAKAANSVVGIEVSRIIGNKWNQYEETVSMGSGIIYSADGIIVTNHHVVEAAINPSTGKFGSAYKVKIYFTIDLTQWAYVTELIGYDSANDIAVLRVNATNLQPIEFADSDKLTTGETAISLGSPGGLEYMNSISEGILSGLNRTISTSTGVIYDLIQTTAAINPGNSGGALLNSEGKLIGICVIKIAATSYESMGFAINSNTVKTIVESIKKYGYYNKPLLGVTINTKFSPSIAKEQGWPSGAYIEEVYKNSTSEKAGIKTEDIITKLNDTSISSFLELRRFMLKCNPGDTVKLEVYRISTGETLTFELKLDGTTK